MAGFLAGQFVRGAGFGLIADIVVGIVGAFIGGFLATGLGFDGSAGLIGTIVVVWIGIVVLLAILHALSPGARASGI
jgi:uncharacterized membrane protein YeaQ/YmgE (transglycosylase-associated protein family)